MSTAASNVARLLRICLVALAAILILPVHGDLGSSAVAQEMRERQSGGGLLRFLFQREQPRRIIREAPRADAPRRAKPTVRRSEPSRATAVPTPEPTIEKAEDARRVLVIGDFLAGGLADGLATAFEQNPDIVVLDRSNGSSGLVRDDFYDWPGEIGSILETEDPTAVVMMIGSNDRQQMSVEGTREEPRSDAWLKEYERRATALVKPIRDKGLPLIWVGNLPFKSGRMSSDMIAFNDVYRRVAEDVGGEFVDVWDGFVDETGTFVTSGPDMNGQPAQLRSSDGINVTKQGRRKIAFYVEKPLNRLLGGGMEPGVALPGSGAVQGPMPGGAPAEIDRTSPMAINDPDLDGGSVLLGASIPPRQDDAATDKESLLRQGIAPEAQPGRADYFLVRKPAAAETAPTAIATDPGRTTALTP